MANGHPKFGGTNGVAVLDVGQVGGTRQTAGNALLTVKVQRGPAEAPAVESSLPQQQRVYQDQMGFSGSTVRWEGAIRADSAATMKAIVQELDQRKHGSLRDGTTGELSAADMSMIKETQLTDSDGTLISPRAVLRDWHQRGRYFPNGGEWAVILKVSIVFRLLG